MTKEDLVNNYKVLTGSTSALDDATGFDAFKNWFTGNLDYQRQLELQGIANRFSASEAQKQRDFEEHMSNTAYSRAVSDMRNAGINPYLLYGSGKAMAASTPAGSSATAVTGSAPTAGKAFNFLLNALGSLVSTAVGAGIRASSKPVYNHYNNTYNNYRSFK